MRYAYVVRFPNDNGPLATTYGIRYLPQGAGRPASVSALLNDIRLGDMQPPTLRKKSAGHFEWDYANEFLSMRDFHRLYPHIRLKSGEGPILVDLDDVATKRTSKHPED